MKRPGQPLRFLGWIVGGWIAMRTLVLLSAAVPFLGTTPERGRPLTAQREAQTPEGRAGVAHMMSQIPSPSEAKDRMLAGRFVGVIRSNNAFETAFPDKHSALNISERVSDDRLFAEASSPQHRREEKPVAENVVQRSPVAPALGDEKEAGRRWSATAWMLWRPDVAGSLAQAPLLGGSQVGARIDYRLVDADLGRIGLYGRVSRALTGAPSEEAALGVAFRPGQAPVSVLAERRQRLGRGGRSGFALLVAGGINPREVAPRLIAEGYAQAGIVGLPGLDGFADGKASLGYRLSPGRSPSRLTLGASLSGGVQPGASRLDIGPELGLRLPTGVTALRLSLEWRERVLGDARPARGPAITLVSGF